LKYFFSIISQIITQMPIHRGTHVVLLLGAKGAKSGDLGRVASRKKNGWLRVTLRRTHKTISVRNLSTGITVLKEPMVQRQKGFHNW
jgi:hypothetical protein